MNSTRGISHFNVPIRPIFSSVSIFRSERPSFCAKTSLTPPAAASRLVCIQMAAMPWRISSVNTLPCRSSVRTVCTLFHAQFITGWCAAISWQSFSMASSTTCGVTSSATRTRCTSTSGSPTSRPTLSQLSANSRGAQAYRYCSISRTVVIGFSSFLLSAVPMLPRPLLGAERPLCRCGADLPRYEAAFRRAG